jgi:hypothetical protein
MNIQFKDELQSIEPLKLKERTEPPERTHEFGDKRQKKKIFCGTSQRTFFLWIRKMKEMKTDEEMHVHTQANV